MVRARRWKRGEMRSERSKGGADRRMNVEWLEWMSRAKYGRMQYIDIVRGYGS